MGNQSKIETTASSSKGEPTRIDALTDDLLEIILLRAISPVCLVRAAATCRLWRRLIAGADFLRRVRTLPQPHVLGCYYTKQAPVVETIFVSAAAPQGIAGVDDCRRLSLSLDFLPHPTDRMRLTDSRGGLLAFADDYENRIVVCNPCTRQYMEVSLSLLEDNKVFRCSYISAFLLDAETDNSPHMSCFRVLYMRLHSNTNDNGVSTQVYLFSARDNRRLLLSSTVAGDIVSAVNSICVRSTDIYFLGRTEGSIFWGIPHVDSNVLILDDCTGKFSVLALPKQAGRMLNYQRVNLRIINGDARTVRFIRIDGDDLEILTVVRDGGTCVVDSRVVGLFQLANIKATKSWTFFDTEPAVGPGCVVLSPDYRNMWMFSVETMMLERLSERTCRIRLFPYELPWPPTIKACV